MGRLLQVLGIQSNLVGVDIGRDAVKAVSIQHGHRGPALRYAGLTELLNPEEQSSDDRGAVMVLYELLRQGGLKHDRLAMSYSGGGLMVRYLTLPKMPREEAKEAIRWEAKKLAPRTFEESVLDFLIIGELEERGLRRLEILLVVAERAAILRQLEQFKSIRSRIEAMDVNPMALLNTVRLNYRNDLAENLVFVDIGAQKMEINIARGGTLRFYRSVQMGGEEITRAISQSLGKSFEEAEPFKRQKGFTGPYVGEAEARAPEAIKAPLDRMILEVQRSIDYYRAQFREGAIRKVILMGGVPLMPGFRDYLATYFEAEVVVDNPFANLVCEESQMADLHQMAPRFSASVGLALRRAGE